MALNCTKVGTNKTASLRLRPFSSRSFAFNQSLLSLFPRTQYGVHSAYAEEYYATHQYSPRRVVRTAAPLTPPELLVRSPSPLSLSERRRSASSRSSGAAEVVHRKKDHEDDPTVGDSPVYLVDYGLDRSRKKKKEKKHKKVVGTLVFVFCFLFTEVMWPINRCQ